MIGILLTHDYSVGKIDRETMPLNADVTVSLIDICLSRKYAKEMPRTDSRIWYRIRSKMSDAIPTVPPDLGSAEVDPSTPAWVELEKSEFEWLRNQLKEISPPFGIINWYWIFWDYLEDLKENPPIPLEIAKAKIPDGQIEPAPITTSKVK